MSAIDSTAEEVEPEPGQTLIPTVPTLAVTPTVKATELVERLDVIRDTMRTAMHEDVDYGVIPGTNKPALLKPGAEKLGVLFQLDVQLENEKTWGPGDHLTVSSHATVYHAPTGSRLGYGEGLCTTREKKYGKRMQDRACPSCQATAIKRSKYPPRDNPQAEPGWYCFAKIGGCGANYAAEDERITAQPVGEVENPDLPDLWNTVVKMAEKRARVDAVLAVTGASALFTQDVEDTPAPEPVPTPPPPVEDAAQELYALLADDGPLLHKRVKANKGMEMVGANVRQRLRELRAATSEDALDALIARCHAAADRQAAKS